jgi:hypothetical protein
LGNLELIPVFSHAVFVSKSGKMFVTYIFYRQACNNSAAYLFSPQQSSMFTPSGFWASCHPAGILTDLNLK